jgi:hypothetical protein
MHVPAKSATSGIVVQISKVTNQHVTLQIASMLDADDLRIEGIMPGGSRSTFTLPVTSEPCRKQIGAATMLAGNTARHLHGLQKDSQLQ